jgi:hypothetical protein
MLPVWYRSNFSTKVDCLKYTSVLAQFILPFGSDVVNKIFIYLPQNQTHTDKLPDNATKYSALLGVISCGLDSFRR